MDNSAGGLSVSEKQRRTATSIARNKVLAAFQNQAQLQSGRRFRSTTPSHLSRQTNFFRTATPIQPPQPIQPAQPTHPAHPIQPPQPTHPTASAQPAPSTHATHSSSSNSSAHSASSNSSTRSASSNSSPHPAQSTQSAQPAPLTKSSFPQPAPPTPVALPPATDLQTYHAAWQRYYQDYYRDYYTAAARDYVASEKSRVAARAAAAPDHRTAITSAADQSATVETSDPEAADTAARRLRQKAHAYTKKHRLRPGLLPLIVGGVLIVVLLFLQYNRLFFAPIAAYVSPGGNYADSLDTVNPTANVIVPADPRLIIPKLNVDVPINFDLNNDSTTMMNAMNNGVAQFLIPGATAHPGQIGNLVITGHSAGDIYSNNQYKFIFSGLERLVDGDTIYINYQSRRHTYSVVGRETVSPDNLQAITRPTDQSKLILVTCTPLGTARYRLLIFANQIDPPIGHATVAGDSGDTGEPVDTSDTDASLPSNEKTFFEGLWDFFTGQG